jgi:PDZ domain-containing protein
MRKGVFRSYWMITIVIVIAVWFIPTPYYLYQPGTMEELGPKIEVEGGEHASSGGFYLTTVLTMPASNLLYLLYGMFAPDTELRTSAEVRGDITEREFDALLSHMMSSSQDYAVHAGLTAADMQVLVERGGVFVRAIEQGAEADAWLDVGDVIVEADGVKVNDTASLRAVLTSGDRKAGDTVELSFLRGNEQRVARVPLGHWGASGVGLGIGTEDEVDVEAGRQVTLHAEDIGGPSAGLMFSLEIYDQATLGSTLTGGYRIAGTGTINLEGEVGQIGGIRHKLVAAVKEGAELFLVPADTNPKDRNTKDIREEAKERGYDIRIESVATVKDAIALLSALPPKQP